ncbi:hypothetical protein X753_07680 [Mesorhizobium sp. LNJC399B00]|uniref:hypothetical protein n=1 Tax=unclassified Mesorhizobium TaxID=325217 RepID=UPI0003CDEE8A|nr:MULTISPECIES: hypothetical protein [unclassified Mesorhizobium]ESY08750.1 hypothetical protein X753_07680 [Mesorhizobium sp. LNJC399B00]WJI69544.1 hypothetical protein NLY36_01700 [Mesorhizobium sp. C399B]
MTADELMNLSQAYRLICKALKDKAIAERRLLSALAESKIRATAGILRPNYDDGRDADRDEDLAFPSPMYIHCRRYWLETALSEWDIQPRGTTKKRGQEGKRPTVKVLRMEDLIAEGE